jgi:hypothetical protein
MQCLADAKLGCDSPTCWSTVGVCPPNVFGPNAFQPKDVEPNFLSNKEPTFCQSKNDIFKNFYNIENLIQ